MLLLITTRLFLGLLCMRHAVHLSCGEITIERNILRGEVTFYRDDWERSTARWYGHAPCSNAERSQMFAEYLKSHFRAWSEGFVHPLAIEITQKADSGLSVSYNVRCELPNASHKIIIDSRAIFSEHADQMNLLTVKVGSKTQSIIFTQDKPTAWVEL